MRSFNGSHTFLLKSVLSSALFSGNRPFRHFKLVHSLHESKPRKPTQKWGKSTKKRAKSLLTRDSDPKVYMRNIIANIYRILKYSTWDSAQQQLENLPIKWDSYTVNQILKTHPPMERAWLFFNWASRLKGFKHDQYTYTTMLDIFGEAGRISSMNYVFKLMQENGIKVDVVTYTSLMHWISSSGDVDGAVKIWQEMKYNGCNPTVVSYTAYLKILFDNKRVKDASDLYREMIRIGISPTCHTYTVLMEYLVSAGKCEEAMEIFSKMQEAAVQPDKAACNILIQRCCKVGETKTMMRILEYMKENCLVLRYPVFLEALETLRVTGETDALLIEVNPHISLECVVNQKAVTCIPTSDTDTLDRDLVLILLKKENLIAIDHLLTGTADEHVQLDSVIISMVIEVNCDRCRFDGTLLAFEYSVRRGLNLESYAYLALIGISIRSNTFLKVLEIVKEMIRAGHSLGVYHSALIIYRLGRARRPTLAAKIFDLLPDQQKCTATYTALISVYFSAGSADKALKIYEIMRRRRIHTALGTYNVLLIGLEKSGKACEIETYRKEKKRLQVDGASSDSAPMDEKICNLLFAG